MESNHQKGLSQNSHYMFGLKYSLKNIPKILLYKSALKKKISYNYLFKRYLIHTYLNLGRYFMNKPINLSLPSKFLIIDKLDISFQYDW